MNRRTFAFFVTAAALISSMTIPAAAQQPGSTAGEKNAVPQMTDYSLPTEWHNKLEPFTGSWNTETRVYLQGPDKPPMVTKGTAELRWSLGKRFLKQEASGEMFGKPFQGIGFTGYSVVHKRYEMFWIDNSTTEMSMGAGTYDKSGKVLSFYGTIDDPANGQYGKNVLYTLTMTGNDKFIFGMADPSENPPVKFAEIIYTRK
jgi:hypothetical protein